jgi:predicted RNA methylase
MRRATFEPFVFADIGSGMKRILRLAATHPFERVIGVKHAPALHRLALRNPVRDGNAAVPGAPLPVGETDPPARVSQSSPK